MSKSVDTTEEGVVVFKEVKKKLEWVGIRFDSEKFEKLMEERWESVEGSPEYRRCKVHGTIFKVVGDPEFDYDVEPCWGCHKECEIRL